MESFQESGSWVCQSLKIWQKLENKRFCQQSGKTELSLLDSVSFTGHIAEMSIEMSRALKLVDFYLTRASFWRRQWHPTPVLLPGKSHGRRSLVGCSLEESDMTERLHFHFSLSCIGEGNGNPLLCSCLENPRDGGAWWAAVYGVAQSQTRLK